MPAIGTRDHYDEIAERLSAELGVYFVLTVHDPGNKDTFFYTNATSPDLATLLRRETLNGIAIASDPSPPEDSDDGPNTHPV